jgi:superfamily II DNA helicase RecQ
MGAQDFRYDQEHGVLICQTCGTCLSPLGPVRWKDHLYREPHRLTGERLRETIKLLSTHIGGVRSMEALRQGRPRRREPCKPILGLAVYRGYMCEADGAQCDFVTRRRSKLQEHWTQHGLKALQHDSIARTLWSTCWLQTYFTAKGKIDYFTVTGDNLEEKGSYYAENEKENNDSNSSRRPLLGGSQRTPHVSKPYQAFMNELVADAIQAKHEMDEIALTVPEVSGDRADEDSWVLQTGIGAHLQGLLDNEIQSSYALPAVRNMLSGKMKPSLAGGLQGDEYGEGSEDSEDSEDSKDSEGSEERRAVEDIRRITAAAEKLLQDGYTLVADRSEERRMTQQRAIALSDFAWGAEKKGRDRAFRSLKNESTLTTYFRKVKQLLAYYYRVVYRPGGHFSPALSKDAGWVVPQDVIEPTKTQVQAMDLLATTLQRQDKHRKRLLALGSESDDDKAEREKAEALELLPGVRRLLMSLICHRVGSQPFQSALVSFCAMHSRERLLPSLGQASQSQAGRDKGTGEDALDERARRRAGMRMWKMPGNFTSHLSAMIWTAQLLIFESACTQAGDRKGDDILESVKTICRTYMHQRGETVFGHLLQWRLYLGAVAQSILSRNQANWSFDKQAVTYLGTTLRMEEISALIRSEFRRAQRLLLDELLFGAEDIPLVESWTLHDDLDREDRGGSWLSDERNAEVLSGTQDMLFRTITGRADLARTFITEDGDGKKVFCRRAMAVYEAYVQDFLSALSPLIHIAPLPPLRAPELQSITHTNDKRRRSTFIFESLVLLHIRYHKSQRQTGDAVDNVRFLPPAIGNLLLTFLAVVQPLRQAFLRQQVNPKGQLSAYLWSTLEGEVWPDQAVSRHLGKACVRAEIPRMTVAWWRQVAASIVKEKFTPSERASFHLDHIGGEEEEVVEEAEELQMDLARSSNHSFTTHNMAYAGSTTLTTHALLYRAHRASQCWRSLFRVDEQLAEEVMDHGAPKTRKRRRRHGEDDDEDSDGEDGDKTSLLSAAKRVRYRVRPLAKAAVLQRVAQRLHGDSTLTLRRPGQRNAMLAMLGPRASEQVVVVLGTGSGKSLLLMVGAAMEGAGTTIVILPTVALRTNMIQRVRGMGIRTVEWSPGQTRTAPLVFASAEAACSADFSNYVARLQTTQVLDRIIVDEAHLTITASRYRKSMKRLGWYVRQVATQSVWLTATLPPLFEEVFHRRNYLTRPVMVRDSTNRRNLRYSIETYDVQDGLTAAAVALAHRCCAAVSGHAADRIIIYCQTKDTMQEIAEALSCPIYTGDGALMDRQAKEEALAQWEGSAGSPVIAATSALSVGYDYAHIRYVIHAGAPRCLTDFSQESGRAGRSGQPAHSIVLLPASTAPSVSPPQGPYLHEDERNADEEAMLLYLSQGHCLRGVLSQFLDQPQDWRWCMEGEDEKCAVCPRLHTERRPSGLVYQLPRRAEEEQAQDELHDEESDEEDEGMCDTAGIITQRRHASTSRSMQYTGPRSVRRHDRLDQEIRTEFEAAMRSMVGSCLLCRVKNRDFHHTAGSCSRRFEWVKAKKRVLADCQREGKGWIDQFTACYMCLMPQTMCHRADPEAGEQETPACQYRDLVLPLCWAAFTTAAFRAIITKEFGRFANSDDYMRALGTTGSLGGEPCIRAIEICARLVQEFRI